MKTEWKGDRGMRLLAVGLLVTALLVTGMCGVYAQLLEGVMARDNDRYLREISKHVASVVNERISDTFRALGAASRMYEESGDVQRIKQMQALAENYGFRRIILVDKNGEETSSDGSSQNLAGEPFIQQILSGEDTAAKIIRSGEDDRQILYYVLPVQGRNGEIKGALAACTDVEEMRSFLEVESYGGEGFSVIIDRQGDVVVPSGNKNCKIGTDNFIFAVSRRGGPEKGYSLQTMQEDMQAGRSGILCYRLDDGVSKSMAYLPLAAEEWYLLSIVPTQVAGETARVFIQLAFVIVGVIVALFVLLFLLFFLVSRKSRRQLEELAFTDSVTGGPNRMQFERVVDARIKKASAGTYALVSLDVQRFKLINDSFGSEEGDRTLRYIYQVIRRRLREGEYAARVSSDDFNLLIYNSRPAELTARLEKLAREINSFNEQRSVKYFLRLCAGIYVIYEPGLSMISLQGRANTARKNNEHPSPDSLISCAFYTEEERLRMMREKELDNRMQSALDSREFMVYLQPKTGLRNGAVTGAEALVRWADPERGLVPPDEFIPVFENNGFIVKLDLFVFQEVCRHLRRWLDMGRKPVPISVNMSRVHLSSPDFLDSYRIILKKYQIPPELLEIELTESLVFENLRMLIRVIHSIHEIGLSCSLDDFGSGYSSLNMLKEVPADVLKLDRAFFENQETDLNRAHYVVESVVELARKLHMKTVAEGVETIAEVDFLRSVGCDMVQGYVFSKPVPVEEFEKLAFAETVQARGGD